MKMNLIGKLLDVMNNPLNFKDRSKDGCTLVAVFFSTEVGHFEEFPNEAWKLFRNEIGTTAYDYFDSYGNIHFLWVKEVENNKRKLT